VNNLREAIESLKEGLRFRNVIALIGPDALVVHTTDAQGQPREVPFYRLLAERLLAQQGLESQFLDEPSDAWDLHRAVGAILANSSSVSTQRLRRSVSQLIRSLSQEVTPASSLQQLAQLTCFDLWVCLTPDDLLSRALQAQQPDVQMDIGYYTPRGNSNQDIDIAPPSEERPQIYHLLGRAEVDTEFAIHDEDSLEHLYRFQEQGERRAKTLLAELRAKDLLFLGCCLPDWMGRSLVRMLNQQRLTLPDRETMEFFCAHAHDPALTGFLDRFSTNSILFPWEPAEFVAELSRLLPQKPSAANRGAAAASAPAASASKSTDRRPSAFISYASEDTPAAQRMHDQLKHAGFGDVWLDRKALVAGDRWEHEIDEAIASCDFFVPLLSRQADQRREGVFWKEWRQAIGRAVHIHDAFMIPIGIDERPARQMAYQRIFSGPTGGFKDLHLLHAPQGQLSAEGMDQLRERVQRFRENSHG
jgi:hypothetical protein